MTELGLPDMRRWRYATLGACQRCGNDEAPGVRLYAHRHPAPAQSLDPPVCGDCARLEDAVRTAEEAPIP